MSAAVKRRLVPFADTSVGFTIRFIIVHSSVALDTDLWGGRCLSYAGREGCERSSAWIDVFSSTLRTIAWANGFK